MAPLAVSIVLTPLAGVAVRRQTPKGATDRGVPRALAVRCRTAAASSPADAPPLGATRVWHCPPPEKTRKAQQACSTISKLPPHVLGDGGLDPATQSPQNQQAYLGSLAERFLPVNLSYAAGDVRVLNVDPPVFAIPRFVPADECDAIVAIAKGGKKLVRNVKRIDLGAKLPAPVADGAPALVQRLAELSENCKNFVRCDGAWLEGHVASAWGTEAGLKHRPPPGAFAFEMPSLCVTARGKTSDVLPDAYDADAANAIGSQRRAICRVFLSDPPAADDDRDDGSNDDATNDASNEGTPDIDRDAYSLKFDILDLALAPAKGTAIVAFPAFADGAVDERAACRVRANATTPTVWMDFPIAVGLDEGGIRKPVSMSDVVVEKVGTEANVGDAARSRNRQEWRADVKGAEGETEEATTEGAAVAEAARKKLDELEKQGL